MSLPPRVYPLPWEKCRHKLSCSKTHRPLRLTDEHWYPMVRLLVGWLMLALTCRPVLTIALPVTLPGSHPSNYLTVVGQGRHASVSSNRSTFQRTPMDIDKVLEEEVMYHLYKNGRLGASYQRKASTVFLVELFNDLVRGLPLGVPGRTKKQPAHSNTNLPFTDTIRSFSAREVTFSPAKKATVHFAMPFLPLNERLRSAELRFLHRAGGSARARSTSRYKLAMAVSQGGRIVKKVVLRERALLQREYHVFDVSGVLETWINAFHGNITLEVRIPRKLETSIQLRNSSLTSTSLIALYLEDRDFLRNMYESYTTDVVQEQRSHVPTNSDDSADIKRQSDRQKPKSRKKRDSSSREKRGRKWRNRKNKRWYRAPKHAKCRLYNFKVDFDFIGWGQWIIHPKNFNSRFCYGQCPSPMDSKYKPTNHAMLQTLMRQKKRRLAPPTCCVPTSLKPLSMLYFELDDIVVRHHEDMIADECGCR